MGLVEVRVSWSEQPRLSKKEKKKGEWKFCYISFVCMCTQQMWSDILKFLKSMKSVILIKSLCKYTHTYIYIYIYTLYFNITIKY